MELLSPGYPTLLHCSNIALEIIECQKQQKKILLSLGGGIGTYELKSKDEAELLAERIWNLFLGGHSTVRPFDQAILDGIDLDIEQGGPEYYTEFVKKLRGLMKMDENKKSYLLTAAPQCPFPDQRLGTSNKRFCTGRYSKRV